MTSISQSMLSSSRSLPPQNDPTVNSLRYSPRTVRCREQLTWASILKISDNRRESIGF